jgi:cytidine deaminase
VVEPCGYCWQRFFDYHHQLIDSYDLPLPSETSYLLLLA